MPTGEDAHGSDYFTPVFLLPQLCNSTADNKDVYLAPWCHKAVEHPETLRPDGFHPEPEGAVLYTDAVEEAIQQAVDGKQRDFGRCAIY